MALKYTDVELGLITDPEAHLMIENMRGGLTTISQRYASANNPQVDGYVDDEERRFITYLDTNSLYTSAQSEPLPFGKSPFAKSLLDPQRQWKPSKKLVSHYRNLQL